MGCVALFRGGLENRSNLGAKHPFEGGFANTEMANM